ncbi:hypothetical protein [Limnoglobus roseus]|uniref:Uncharacterized protein n=1 Tax=Limnoglobus roseus TaxID=2598579 RepID=A0A5C1ALL3_9BACT|nr:hypothetical protein [Limnoglobus roseus]QEL19850.1 hypothetical protein PX52LOC_06931 [Limnoglobus roseus]
MSDDDVRTRFEACNRRLGEERRRPEYIPLHAAICRPEGPGGSILHDDLFGAYLGTSDYTQQFVSSVASSVTYAVAHYFLPDRGFVPSEHVNTLIQQVDGIAKELHRACAALPERIRLALRLPEVPDWWGTLFHLAWHFDRPFLRAARCRLMTQDDTHVVRVGESIMQEIGHSGRDVMPGLIFSRLDDEVFSASEAAVGLILDAIDNGRSAVPPLSAELLTRRLVQLKDQFQAASLGKVGGRKGGPKTKAKALRLSDSFTNPPATSWAALKYGGKVPQSTWPLNRLNADQEICQVVGPENDAFINLATIGGNTLPAESLSTPIFLPPVGRGTLKASAALPLNASGPVPRWLRFVFTTLLRHRPELVNISWHKANPACGLGTATLKPDVFAASVIALEIELASLGLAPTGANGRASGLIFDDPWDDCPHPPPAVGRYVRFQLDTTSAGGEQQWRPAWTWAEKPQDGWAECGTCGDGSLVLVATGSPPAVCDWLPRHWPARFYPLGTSVVHCEGWRSLVKSVFIDTADTIPPDDPRFGWQTLARTTREFAHHLGAVTLDRLTAPLPATRPEARREVLPLLDGIIAYQSRAGTKPNDEHPQGGRLQSNTPPRTGRPPDARKKEITEFARELRTRKVPWKSIPDAVFNKYGVKYSSETLRGYLKGG